ncbi:phosphonate transport system permease protein [Rubritalea squalenifaciens DSM 18772]|uniref:Phosphonate transport system permease protein n=1 Tax=Rubritalea squalenifaciens DSM 18772 TaxID=1123071 RepID=A0A1M6HQG6_9BACT|nr:phosphonate transport system permease protein [Rubritalea squalenifaciens DSM 18772]
MNDSTPELKPPLWSWRRTTITFFFIVFIFCLKDLGLKFNHLPDGADPWQAAKDFFSAALNPAFTDQNPSLPADAKPFLERIGENMLATLRYAFVAMSMALPAGLILGILCSRSWWPKKLQDSTSSSFKHYLLRLPIVLVYLVSRFFTTLIRSVHELIWVMLFLAFLGDSPLTACIAIALPYAGTLAKVFSEIIDEQDARSSDHLVYSGAGSLQAFFAARLPQSLPDLLTYTMYRLECAIRSSAVLGFIGIETIGLTIKQSYENNYYNEVWTGLYSLILVVMAFDILGAHIRKRLHTAPHALLNPDPNNIRALKRHTPRWPFMRLTWTALLFTSVAAWFIGEPLNQYHSHLSRWERTKTFAEGLLPKPVRESHAWSDAIPWAENLWTTNGAEALLSTVIMASAALLLAAIFGYAFVPWASRNIASAKPFGLPSGHTSKVLTRLWSFLGWVVRTLFLIARSIPEFILAFLLIGIIGPHAWPLVIALAIHNFGILGRLWSETHENQDDLVAKQQILSGGSRNQSYLCALLPASFNRQILFIFYRWETCVRESTILGLLSITSLGYYISLESSFLRYDSMLFYILLGTAVIFISDIISVILRAKLKNS